MHLLFYMIQTENKRFIPMNSRIHFTIFGE